MRPLLQGVQTGLLQLLQGTQAELQRERHLRHQADGRLGAGAREASQAVRREAAYWQKRSEADALHVADCHKQALESQRMVAECHQTIVQLAQALAAKPAQA